LARHYLDILAEVIRDNWDCPALTDYSLLQGEGGNEYTYGQMYEKIQELCQLFAQLGLQPGDHIALCGANSANWAVAYLAIAAFRGVSVTILHTLSSSEIVQLINYADCNAIFVDSEIWKSINELCVNAEQVVSLADFSIIKGTSYQDNDSSFKPFVFSVAPLDDLAQICFTSGTASAPKGVMLSYRNLSNNVQNTIETLPIGHNKPYVASLPLSHAYGLMGELLCQLPHANHIYFVSVLVPSLLSEALLRIQPYYWVTIPLIVEAMHPILDHPNLKSIQQILVGGALLNPMVETNILSRHLPLSVGYGMTETAPLIGASLFSDYRPYSVGFVVSGMKARISPEGEILVRGENVMLGYYKDELATREKIDADGWLHTGDRGHLDEDGYLYVEGRMNLDMIVLPSGENIHPENIEAIINGVPYVVESLVLAREGKLVALVRKDTPVTAERTILERNAILAKVNPQLPSFSQLFGIEFITDPLQRTEKQTIKRYLYQ